MGCCASDANRGPPQGKGEAPRKRESAAVAPSSPPQPPPPPPPPHSATPPTPTTLLPTAPNLSLASCNNNNNTTVNTINTTVNTINTTVNTSSSDPGIASAYRLLASQADRRTMAAWEADRWPWPWLLVHPPHPKRSDRTAYAEFLGSFRILQNEEVDAYGAWQRNEKEAARELLRRPVQPPPPAHPPAPEPSKQSPGGKGTSASSTRNCLSSGFESQFEIDVEQVGVEVLQRSQEEGQEGAGAHRHDAIQNPFIDVRSYTVPSHSKTPEEEQLLTSALQQCKLFHHVVRNKEILQIAGAMRKVTFTPGERVFTEGEVPADDRAGFHVVASGSFRSFSSTPPEETLEKGGFFGQYMVTSSASRSLRNVEAVAPGSSTFVLESSVFLGVMGRQAFEKRRLYRRWLGEIEFLKDQSPADLIQLADALEEKKYAEGEKIIEFGQVGDYMHFIVEGSVEVWGRKKNEAGRLDPASAKWVCDFQPGHPIGYLEFFEVNPVTNIADVIAKEPVITARINRRHFEKCMGSVKDLLKALTEAPEYEYYRSNKAAMPVAEENV